MSAEGRNEQRRRDEILAVLLALRKEVGESYCRFVLTFVRILPLARSKEGKSAQVVVQLRLHRKNTKKGPAKGYARM